MNDLQNLIDTIEPRVLKAVLACRDMMQLRYSHLDPEIILYGSQAKGTAHLESDIDLLILTNQSVSAELKNAICGDLYEIELELDVVISPLIKSRQQWDRPVVKVLPLYRNIQREGVRVA
ncbi:MAG: nucleotidyltransferase domain-containing protein [Planctomycetaceae bacterium]|nr:nucleotidyltransferase domain-containing protein [Planctomycetaceae bacterium]